MEDIENHLVELTRLEQICSHQDARDAAELKYVLDRLLSSWRGLRDNEALDAAMLATRLDRVKAELDAQIEEKELGLDATALSAMTAADIENSRRERSALWLEDARGKCERIANLSAERLGELYAWLKEKPAYVTDQDSAELKLLRSRVHALLVQQKMTWLLQEFSTLPKEQQKLFFEHLRTLMNSSV